MWRCGSKYSRFRGSAYKHSFKNLQSPGSYPALSKVHRNSLAVQHWLSVSKDECSTWMTKSPNSNSVGFDHIKHTNTKKLTKKTATQCRLSGSKVKHLTSVPKTTDSNPMFFKDLNSKHLILDSKTPKIDAAGSVARWINFRLQFVKILVQIPQYSVS